jgi:nardilysin
LTVLLISDAQSAQINDVAEKQAAASLCIDVGSFHDAEIGIPGMAHFVEHMVFMGSEKYPDENAYDKFITSMGGRYNATTHYSFTFFYFSVNEEGFHGAIDRLSNFFISPLMLKDSINRERNAVESEFQNRYNDDRARLDQLFVSCMTRPDHPAHTFPWGNLKTLKDSISDDDLYAKVHKFHKKHYVANKMYLCLQSKLKLDELQELAVKYFSDVPFKADIDPPLSENPKFGYLNAFKPEFFEKMYFMKPKSDQIKLVISWILPSNLKKYRCKSQQFIAHIIGHEGPGSLCSYLRNK